MKKLFVFLFIALISKGNSDAKNIIGIFIPNCIYDNYEKIDTLKDKDNIIIDKSKVNFDKECSENYIYDWGAYSFTQLGEYCNNGDIKKLILKINSGACINNCMSDPSYVYDLLYTALVFKKIDIIRLLLQNGIYQDINFTYTEEYTTPLYLACKIDDHEEAISIVKLLLSKGAQVNITGYLEGEVVDYPIIAAVVSDNVPLVKLLIDNGADLSVLGREGFSVKDLVENFGSDQMKALFKNY